MSCGEGGVGWQHFLQALCGTKVTASQVWEHSPWAFPFQALWRFRPAAHRSG